MVSSVNFSTYASPDSVGESNQRQDSRLGEASLNSMTNSGVFNGGNEGREFG